MKFQLLLICHFLGLGSAWSQPSNCLVWQSACSGDSELKEDIKGIRETLVSISTSLQQLVTRECQEQAPLTTEPPTDSAVGTFMNPASSCSDIPQNRPSGYYYITNSTGYPVQVYCDTNQASCSCNTTGGWMRAAYLDMKDLNQNCPDGFRLMTRTKPPLRTCGSPASVQPGCVSTTYQTHGVEYSHVCGRIIGYQDETPGAFVHYNVGSYTTIDTPYVDGVSLTHGQSPRQHIWTFTAALDEQRSNYWACPCTRPDAPYTGSIPPFIGQDYFCETGSRNTFQRIFYPDDPLWDGQGCGGTSTCCQFNNPPWFCKQLPQPTTDDIELRICAGMGGNDGDTPLELIEIYVH